MTIGEDQVRHVAKLACLDLEDSEVSQYSHDLSNILDLIEKLNQLNIDAVSEADAEAVVSIPVHGKAIEDFRLDTPNRPFSREHLMANAPDQEEGYFRVPRILE